MPDATDPTNLLIEMRKLAGKITDADEAHKSIDAVSCVRLARAFQDLDQSLCEGGDAPEQWTA